MKRTAAFITFLLMALNAAASFAEHRQEKLTSGAVLMLNAAALFADNRESDNAAYGYYGRIPAVTQNDINAIEALKAKRPYLTYGFIFDTRTNSPPDEVFISFTHSFFSLLSSILGVEIRAVSFAKISDLKNKLDAKEIDFTACFTPTPDLAGEYKTSVPIAGRVMNIFRHKDSGAVDNINDITGRRVCFVKGAADRYYVSKYYPDVSFEAVEAESIHDAVAMIGNGETDYFMIDRALDAFKEHYGFLTSQKCSRFMYTPISITTAGEDLAAVISVINKYLNSGGMEKLFELYNEKVFENSRSKLFNSFTLQERAYIEKLKSENIIIDAGLQHDAYPACFYNKVEKKYDGIAVSILDGVTKLTGIVFEPKTTAATTALGEMLAMLKEGKISMITQLLYSDSRKNDYVWSEIPYLSTKYALISKLEFPNLTDYQVNFYRVGTVDKSIHEEMFHLWYPDHKNSTVYATGTDAFEALEKGEVDLIMLAEDMLLVMTNFQEKTGYKINLSFDAFKESRFGYGKGEELLASIVDKSMAYIDIDGIRNEWLNRSFDYSAKYSRMRIRYMTVFASGAVAALIILMLILTRNMRLNGKLRALVLQLKESKARELEAINAKSEFFANMSHEMRTPMNAIIGMSRLLESEELTDRQRGYINDISAASATLLSIVNNILDVSKIEAGKVSVVPVDYDFDRLISNIGSMFRFLARKKNLDFQYEKLGELPACLYGDDMKLRQVLINICANAVNYTNSGFVRFTVSADGDTLVFKVKDTGPGIKEEDMETLFLPFARLDPKRNRGVKGSGLGLAISKSFVDMMGGAVSVESRYGEGSVFTVTVPKVPGNPANIEQSAPRGDKIAFAAPAARILLVDDNSLNLRVAQGLLGLYGISADAVSSGKESIEAVQKNGYDIVFMDHMMPEMDGIQAARKIRALEGERGNVVIVALTANFADGARDMFLQNGFNDFLSKPIELDKMSGILKKWIPAQKIEERAVNISGAKEDGFLDKISKITSINTKTGMNRCFNSAQVYRETLELFSGALFSDRAKMESFLRDKDIGNFAILVHGVKTSLATVGASALSERALELETAAKRGDAEFCVSAAQPFFEELAALYEKLSAVFARNETNENFPVGDRTFLHENIKTALSAAQNFYEDLGIETLNKLLAYDYGEEINDTLKEALKAFKEFDFDAASDCLNKIEETGKTC